LGISGSGYVQSIHGITHYEITIIGTEILKLAHFSVKEYLVSPRIRHGPAAQYSLSKRLSDTFISHTCLVYLIQFDTIDFFSQRSKSSFPLAQYVADYWGTHAKSEDGAIPDALEAPIAQLLEPNSTRYINWVRLYNKKTMPGYLLESDKPSPLYCAAWFGLEKASRWLLFEKGQPLDSPHNCPLGGASFRGHETIARLLLDNGANVNSMDPFHGTALWCASLLGHENIVRLLLENGADVNFEGVYTGTALRGASRAGHEAIVRLLLENGAEINTNSLQIGTALSEALAEGHEAVVRLLLENGANVEEQDIEIARLGRHEAIMLLLEKKLPDESQISYTTS
jgi:hypothetical protein